MYNICKLFPVLLLLLLTGGCANPSWTTAGKIVPPVYEVCPLEGKWSVTEKLNSDGYANQTGLGVGNSILQFSREAVILGSNVWNKPAYKIKKVNAKDYLMTRYNALDSNLASSRKVEVVTVFADSNYLGEFMRIDDEAVIAFVQNKVLLLHKIAAHADDPRSVANASIDDRQYNKTGASGVFIGLRTPSDKGYIYKTIWIATDNMKLHPVLSRNDIYFPRKSGFWELQVQSTPNQEENSQKLSAHNLAVKDLTAINENVSTGTTSFDAAGIIIDYIGNDYVAIENNSGIAGKLQILPIDKLSSSIGIEVTDLLGPTGLKAYHSARGKAMQTLNSRGTTLLNTDVNEDNFGLKRKEGHWHLRGRVNYNDNSTPGTTEFNINFLPPASLVFYDALYPGWQSIKDRVPNALDAITSPNKDVAVVRTKSRLYIFGINGEQLNSVPLEEIALEEGTTIIMAEWATGFYVDDWERSFSVNGASVLEK